MIRLLAQYFTANNNLQALQLTKQELISTKDEVNKTIEEAQQLQCVPTKEAKEWLDQVNTIEEEVDVIQEGIHQRHQCLCLSKQKISEAAERKLEEMKSLLSKKSKFQVIEFPVPCDVPKVVPGPINLEIVMNFVNGGVEGTLGIWGVGGVGKTHLLKQVYNSLSLDPSFDAVIFVTCSKECTEEKIQNEILEKFRLPKSSSLQYQAKAINNFLKEKNFAFLMDDIWGRLDLKLIGIPPFLGIDGPTQLKRKVILTTRSEEVCEAMQIREKIKVECLKGDKALFLFEEKVGNETMPAHPLIPILAEDMIKELDGLPLALIVTGRAMRDEKDPRY